MNPRGLFESQMFHHLDCSAFEKTYNNSRPKENRLRWQPWSTQETSQLSQKSDEYKKKFAAKQKLNLHTKKPFS